MEIKGTLDLLLLIGGVIFTLAVVGGVVWYGIRQGKQRAGSQALAECTSLNEMLTQRNVALTDENKNLSAELSSTRRELTIVKRDRDDVALMNLRLNSRLANYEKCINRLERKCNLPETNFDDPSRQINEDSHS